MTDRRNDMNGAHAHVGVSSVELLAQWRNAVAEEVAALEASANAEAPLDENLCEAYRAAAAHTCALARRVWERPVSGSIDLCLRAEVARHRLWTGDPPRFEAVLSGRKYDDGLDVDAFDERAVAELVRAVMWAAKPGLRTPALPATAEPVVAWGDVNDLVDRAKAGLMALRTLWNSHATVPAEQREGSGAFFAFGASIEFTADAIEALLDDIAEAVAPASGDDTATPRA